MNNCRPKLVQCAFCGVEFVRMCSSSKYCSQECREEADKASRWVWEEIKDMRSRYKPRSQPKVPLEDAVRMAKELGLSYGQFVARMEEMK